LQGETVEEIVKPEWFAKFCEVDREVMFQLVAAANFLNIKPLLDLTCLAVSVSIKGKSVEELRSIFNLPAPENAGAGAGGEVKDSDDEDAEMEP
jgi:S-phase kinase-associated protein 1